MPFDSAWVLTYQDIETSKYFSKKMFVSVDSNTMKPKRAYICDATFFDTIASATACNGCIFNHKFKVERVDFVLPEREKE